MRNLAIALMAVLSVSSAFAQELHQATPFEVLLQQYRDAHPSDPAPMTHDMAGMDMSSASNPASGASLQPASLDLVANATKAFNVTAKQFAFTISPTPFVVNQGDTVTLTVTSSDVTHGFFLETYGENGGSGFVLQKGKNTTVTFVANTPGTFTYFCTVPSCGSGHPNMFGTMTVAAQSNPAPIITTFVPTSGPTTGGTNVLITGTNFSNNATVKFGSLNAVSVNVSSATSINATAPAQSAGSVAISVTNPDGQSATSTSLYTYVVPQPTLAITTVSPVNGSPAGGTPVTITGTGFSSGLSVTFGGTPGTAVQVTSATSLTVVTPAHAAGKVDVVLTGGGSSATAAGAFTYEAPGPKRRAAKHA